MIRIILKFTILQVPGIGRAAVRKLNENGISTTFVLIGKFLTLKEENVQSAEHCDRFWYFLQSVGIDAYRSGIVQCIAMKVDTLFPGIYDGSFYE